MPELLLRSYHEVRGALFRPEAGWDVPVNYGAFDAEVLAVRRNAGMIDLSDRAKIRVTGADRVTFVDGLLTADVKLLTPGTSAYALVLDDKSHVLGDLRVFALDDAFVLDMEAAQKDALLARFRKMLVSDDVTLEDLGPCGHLEVHGPHAPRLVSAAIGADVRLLSVDAVESFRVDRRRTGYAARIRATGEAGYAIWAPGAALEDVWAYLDRANVPPIGRDAFEALRIEAGVPRFGVDMTEDTLALEVAPDGAISFTKGCYTGQEVVARGTYVGHMNRKLLGLRIDGDVPPARGDRVTLDVQDVGFVTSGTWSPAKGWVIALALLRVDAVRNSRVMFIDHAGWDLRARLYPLPFVRGSG
ncbi:MAG TPA: glycine cleavage T C-terminal barrel domain-containing protein [Thermoplasmata archaeon]|nr:glycine cleavage T C-terminal barrel domain-containing protein [Thermoplasmata archaeon]